MKMKYIPGFTFFTVDGVSYEWNATFSAYWSVNGEPRVLQQEDAAILSLNDEPLYVGDPMIVGFVWKNVTDASWAAMSLEQHAAWLRNQGKALGLSCWEGELKVCHGDSVRTIALEGEHYRTPISHM